MQPPDQGCDGGQLSFPIKSRKARSLPAGNRLAVNTDTMKANPAPRDLLTEHSKGLPHQRPGAPSPGRAVGLCGAAALRAWRSILYHTLPGPWGRGTSCIPEHGASWGCECRAAGAHSAPSQPIPSSETPMHPPARAAQQMGEGAGRGPGSRHWAENRARTSKYLRIGNRSEEDAVGVG